MLWPPLIPKNPDGKTKNAIMFEKISFNPGDPVIKKTRIFCWVILVGFFLFQSLVHAVDLGIMGGKINHPSSLNYGLSLGFEMPIPFVHLEFDWIKNTKDNRKFLTGAVTIRPKLSKLVPFGCLGVGTEYDKLNFKFSQYKAFTFFGGGLYLYMNEIMSLRLDFRYLNRSDQHRIRWTFGLFFHL